MRVLREYQRRDPTVLTCIFLLGLLPAVPNERLEFNNELLTNAGA